MEACIAGPQLEYSHSSFSSGSLVSLKPNSTRTRPVWRSPFKAEAPSVASAGLPADRNLDNPRIADWMNGRRWDEFWDDYVQSESSFSGHHGRTHKPMIGTKPINAHKDQDDHESHDEVCPFLKAKARAAPVVIFSQKSPGGLILPAYGEVVNLLERLALKDRERLSVSSKAHYTGPGVCPVNRDGRYCEDKKWYLDTGATVHVCHSRDEFDEYIDVNGPPVVTANNSIAAVIGCGTVKLSFPFGQVVTLKGVLHVPTINKCLVSMIKLEDDGFGIRIESGEVLIYSKCSNIDEDGFSMHLGEEELHFRGRKFAGYGIREDEMYRLCLPEQLPA